MSGWIKFEKSIETDPRVLRMARAIGKRYALFDLSDPKASDFDPCNACALPAVTLVCGALSRLWCYADTHIREDDVLDLGITEIDEVVGLPGFAEICPVDWLEPVDDEHVKLPGYHAHNGTEAKKRALTQKRVVQHREKVKRISVTPCNASALPDQDQTKTRKDQTRDTRNARAGSESVWQKVKCEYPAGIYRESEWLVAEKHFQRLIEQGEPADKLFEAVTLYRAQQLAKQSIGTQYVLSPSKFFGEKHWRGPFPLPMGKADVRLAGNLAVMHEFLEGTQ